MAQETYLSGCGGAATLDHAQLVRMQMAGRAIIGTSGWNYDGWKNDFYAGVPRKQWLEFCAERFTGLEANGTFYKLQAESTFEKWIERTPDDFVFAAKGHRFVTHNKKLLDPEETVVTSRDNIRALSEKLDAMVWQLQARFSLNFERVETFVRTLADRWGTVRHAIEFRHPTWFSEEVAELLAEHNVAVCQSDAADWPLWDAVTSDLVYVRLHGHTRTYHSKYDGDLLDEWADKILAWTDDGRDVHVYFDNDAEGAAPYDALELMERIGQEKPAVSEP